MKLSNFLAVLLAVALATLQANFAYAQAAAAVLQVNDPDAVGRPGDALLSLDEAIRLANGKLAIDRLSAGERAQVRGAPGPRSRDLIALPQGATLRLAKGATLSPLAGNDGDTLDGGGAMLESGDTGQGAAQPMGLSIVSSNFILRNLQARGFTTAVNVDFGGRRLTNISLEKLRLLGASASALLTIGATTSEGSLRGITVADSLFDTEGKIQGNLVFIAAARTPPGGTTDNVLLEDLRVVRNRFAGGRLGLYVTGSLGAGRTVNAVTRNALVADNVFTGQHDAAANLVGALPAIGGRHTKVGLQNVVASGNRMEAANWGFYMGNEMFGANNSPGTMTDSFLRDITVTRNTIVRGANGSVGQCIALENAADYVGDQIANNLIENIRITDNEMTGCVARRGAGGPTQPVGAGVVVHGGKGPISGPASGGGIARSNVARNIEISRNRIKDSTRGIVVVGGVSFDSGPASGPTTITGNRVTGVRIQGNRLENNATGIRVTAGDSSPGGQVTGNSVSRVTIAGNRITGSRIACEALANAGSATGNTVDAACPAP